MAMMLISLHKSSTLQKTFFNNPKTCKHVVLIGYVNMAVSTSMKSSL